MAKLEIQSRVKVVCKDEFEGMCGVVYEAFHHRGEASSYRVALQGVEGLQSFIDGELKSLEVKTRKRPRDVSDLA